MKSLIVTLAVILGLAGQTVFADEDSGGGKSIIGLQGGQVILNGDVGTYYTGSLGWGLFYRYFTSDKIAFELSYINSRHSGNINNAGVSLTQHAITGDLAYVFNHWVELLPYAKAGIDFVLHAPQDVPGNGVNTTYSSLSGFGFNIGLGADYMLSDELSAGLDLTFHNMFDASASAPGAVNVKVIQGYSTVMARVSYHFDTGNSESHKEEKPLVKGVD